MVGHENGVCLWLEDLSIGQEFHSEAYSVSAEEIIEFAKKFDPQPFHLDPEAAQETFFRGLAASGWHTMAITMRLVVESMPFARGIIGSGGEISWPRPTRPGDILRVRSRIEDITPSKSRPDQGTILVSTVTRKQQDEVVQNLRVNLLGFGNLEALGTQNVRSK